MTKEKDPKEQPEMRTHDVRIIERSIKKGTLSRKEYDKYLKTLPDSKDKVKPPEG